MTLNPATFLALKRGDHDAFHEVYRQFRSLLFVVIMSIVKHQTAAEDVLQDTFLKIYQKAHTVKNCDHFQSWAVMVAKRTALNHLKTLREEVWQDHYDQTMVANESRSLFQTWHANLTDEENLVIAYKIVYDLGFLEISKLMNLPMTTTYKMYQVALKKLKVVYTK